MKQVCDDDEPTMEPWVLFPLRCDDRQKFVSIVKSRLEYESRRTLFDKSGKKVVEDLVDEPLPSYMKTRMFFPNELWTWVVYCCAVDCATAMLEGETGILVEDINGTLDNGLTPLHHAATSLKFDLVELFLRHGARTDLRSSSRENSLPINVALEVFGYALDRIDQNSKKSFNNLFITLCRPEMREVLKTVRLLACNTSEISKVFNDYAKEGNLIEMAVLGIVAKDCVMPPSTSRSKDASIINGSMTIRENIIEEIGQLAVAETKVSVAYGQRIELVQKCKAKTAALMSALKLLELFEKAGDAIGSYFQSQKRNMRKGRVIKDVEAILENAGFFLKDIDLRNINCNSSEIKEAAKASETSTANRSQQHLGLLRRRFHNAKWKSWSRSPSMQVEQMKIPYPQWSPAFRSHLPANHCLRHYSGFNELTEAQSKGGTTATPRAVRLPSKSSNLLASFALAIKRGIRHL